MNKTESEGTFAEVARYKWEQAKDDLKTAEIEPIAFKKHKDTLGYFNKNYVNKEIVPREIGRKYPSWRLSVIRVIMIPFILRVRKMPWSRSA